MLLTGVGGMLGLAIGYVIVRVLTNSAGTDDPRLQDAAFNTPVLMFSAGVCVVVAMLLSVAPMIAPRANVESQLRAAGGSTLSSAGVRRWHSALVVLELACALIPLAGAGLMLRSLSQVRSDAGRVHFMNSGSHIRLAAGRDPAPITGVGSWLYRVAKWTPFAAFAISAATAFGWDT